MEGPELKKWRIDHQLTQQGLAKLLGIAGITVFRWEVGMRKIPPFLNLALECLKIPPREVVKKGKTEEEIGLKSSAKRQSRK